MENIYLIKVGEILLKLGNRADFENRLKSQIKQRLHGLSQSTEYSPGRFFVVARPGHEERIEKILECVPGINSFAPALRTEKNYEAIAAAASEIVKRWLAAKSLNSFTFKIESRRSDKSFPHNSFELSSKLGTHILEQFPGATVDVHDPQLTINVEVRERAYIYGDGIRTGRGLPTGSQGRSLLLLSGGIDSPVAGYLMALRGLKLHAVYFHAHPYTSPEAKQKVIDLAKVIARYTGGITLWVIPFTATQLAIKKNAREDCTTLIMRAAMVELSHNLAHKIKANSLISGESLGQVASQTAENMRFTGSFTTLPIFRPLIGTDKEDTIKIARKIGSYEISILPYEDCCTLFSPKHPILAASFEKTRAIYTHLELTNLLTEALDNAERILISTGGEIIIPDATSDTASDTASDTTSDTGNEAE